MNEGPINTPQAAVGTWTPEGETPPRPSEDDLIAACASVFDPEIPVNIYELGLIYDVDVAQDGEVTVTMTLTAPNCPVAGSLPGEVQDKIAAIPGVAILLTVLAVSLVGQGLNDALNPRLKGR